MERVTINTTKEFCDAVEEYRHDHPEIKTLSKAVAHLAFLALMWHGYLMPDAEVSRSWGGKRERKNDGDSRED